MSRARFEANSSDHRVKLWVEFTQEHAHRDTGSDAVTLDLQLNSSSKCTITNTRRFSFAMQILLRANSRMRTSSPASGSRYTISSFCLRQITHRDHLKTPTRLPRKFSWRQCDHNTTDQGFHTRQPHRERGPRGDRQLPQQRVQQRGR